MNRRDTIIVAVIVNAALLMILFVTANRDNPSASSTHSQVKLVQSSKPSKESGKEATVRDDLLNQYVASLPTPAEKSHEELSYEEVPIVYTPPTPVEPTHEATPLSESKESVRFANVTVKQGDFLEKIARANNTTVAAIMQHNHLSSSQLKIGQVLKIPLKDSSTPAPEKVATGDEYYVVKEGDNPWLIASRNKIKLEELLKINGLDDAKAKKLRPGDKLRIR